MRVLWSKIRTIFGRARALDRELEQEIEAHLQFEADEILAGGADPRDARLAARRNFGNATLIRESARRAWRIPLLDILTQDLRYAVRTPAKSPGFAFISILSLAIGIGANTSIFSVIDALLLRMLPVRAPEQLVRVVNPNLPEFGFPYRQYERLRTARGPFIAVAGAYTTKRANVFVNGSGGGVEPAPLAFAMVSGSYFPLLGIDALVGRTIGPDDDSAERQQPVAFIGYAYWKRRFSLAPDGRGTRRVPPGIAGRAHRPGCRVAIRVDS